MCGRAVPPAIKAAPKTTNLKFYVWAKKYKCEVAVRSLDRKNLAIVAFIFLLWSPWLPVENDLLLLENSLEKVWERVTIFALFWKKKWAEFWRKWMIVGTKFEKY